MEFDIWDGVGGHLTHNVQHLTLTNAMNYRTLVLAHRNIWKRWCITWLCEGAQCKGRPQFMVLFSTLPGTRYFSWPSSCSKASNLQNYEREKIKSIFLQNQYKGMEKGGKGLNFIFLVPGLGPCYFFVMIDGNINLLLMKLWSNLGYNSKNLVNNSFRNIYNINPKYY